MRLPFSTRGTATVHRRHVTGDAPGRVAFRRALTIALAASMGGPVVLWVGNVQTDVEIIYLMRE
jgi:hypothetical protein